MLHRIVSRTVVVLAATAFLASCEDNTTGTPLTPPPASTAVYVHPITPDGGYLIDTLTIPLPGGPDTTFSEPDTVIVGPDTTITVDTTIVVDTLVHYVTPDPIFAVVLPNGDTAVGQVVTFNLNLPGFLEETKDTVPPSGFVTPGRWVVGAPCPDEVSPPPFCRPAQSVIASPVSGDPGVITVSVIFPTPVPPELRASR